MSALDKAQVERQFQRAASSYDQAAQLQRDIFLDLGNHLRPHILSPASIADLGCGTGFGLFEAKKQYPDAKLVGVDISQAMLEQAKTSCSSAEFIKADMESLPLPNEQFDLVLSSSSLQWCDPRAAISEAARVLQPRGHIAIATFGPKTHKEWKTAWTVADTKEHTLNYPRLEDIEQIFEIQGIDLLKTKAQMCVLNFNTIAEVLQSVNDLGATNANTNRQRGLMGKARFNRFLQAFDNSSSRPQLSYEVLFLIGQKQD